MLTLKQLGKINGIIVRIEELDREIITLEKLAANALQVNCEAQLSFKVINNNQPIVIEHVNSEVDHQLDQIKEKFRTLGFWFREINQVEEGCGCPTCIAKREAKSEQPIGNYYQRFVGKTVFVRIIKLLLDENLEERQNLLGKLESMNVKI